MPSRSAIKIGIPLHTANFAADYWDNVFEHFLEEYKVGRTPNPDILCNREIKFKVFLDYAEMLGANYIATGHYVRRGNHKGQATLLKGLDNNKDQSYFLHAVNEDAISKSLFPVGELDKSEVRKIAEDNGFITSKKKIVPVSVLLENDALAIFLSNICLPNPAECKPQKASIWVSIRGLCFTP